MFSRIHFHGRIVDRITSEEGKQHYYDKFKYWRTCCANTNPCHIPTQADALEYISLKAEEDKLWLKNNLETRLKLRKFRIFDSRYDWRPHKTESESGVGLVSPTGEQILPAVFVDVFTQFDAINQRPDFIPVFNGEAWGLASFSDPPVMMTDFIYNDIIPERWERTFFFVQDRLSMKWGVISLDCPIVNNNHKYRSRIAGISTLMPPIADEIYEDELITDDEPTLFFMTRIGDKVGILTTGGYSDIIYDTYETNDDKLTFRLICNDRKRARRADYWHPDGKNLIVNIIRRKIR